MRDRVTIARCVLLAVCAACGGTDTTGPSNAAALSPLSIVSGANVADTVQVTLVAPLVVAVKAVDGAPRAGVSVRFDAVGSPDPTRAGERMIGVAPPAGASFAASDVETTDAQGRASARIQFGTIAGAARVSITTSDGLTDTARFTVRAGMAVTMTVAIHDTTINFNDAFPLAAVLRDRVGNARTELPTTSVTTLIGTAPTVSADGVVRAGANLGRARIGVQGLGTTDSVFVNVVPAATVAMLESDGLGLRIVQSNGKLVRRILTTIMVMHDEAQLPSWSPDGGHFAVTAGGINNAYSIQVFDSLGNAKLLTTAGNRAQYYGARYSRDGQWLYFIEVDQSALPAIATRVYRMHPDGSGKEIVYFASGANWTAASPSATGDFVILSGGIYQVGPSGEYFVPQISRLDASQQRLIPFPTAGTDAAYSAAADRVAMIDSAGRILIVQSSGAGVHTLTTNTISATSFGPLSSLAWSPDGAYLLARSASAKRYVVVRVADGMVVPTAIPSALGQPSWRP